ncbi:SET domain-containing protein [Beauveria bassiana]|uniref:SET domain-containing protein n=1 Tax=Beauveria bassiana TaxID=176275 RepID=A0A2N6NVW0_BEABA|nr:SET domain-containing protein [Beauveria bassiana]
MDASTRLDRLRQSLTDGILDQLAEKLLNSSRLEQFSTPVLRWEAFVHEGGVISGKESLIASRSLDLSDILAARSGSSPSPELAAGQDHHTCAQNDGFPLAENLAETPSSPRRSFTGQKNSRTMVSGLRPTSDYDVIDTHRQMEVTTYNFPKRAKTHLNSVLEQPSLTKFITSLWEQIHGGVILEPQIQAGQALLTSASDNNTHVESNAVSSVSLEALSSAHTTIYPVTVTSNNAIDFFSHNNIVCRKVTQASRTYRSFEVLVQARWIENFDSYVEYLAVNSPSKSSAKCRKTALMEACQDFKWSEREIRNKMAIWKGYKDIKDAAGWAALVFSGLGLYRLAKYRIGLDQKGFDTLRRLKLRIEVAADTLHPHWRKLLACIGESTDRLFTGHPHDWVVSLSGSEPVPLRHTYVESDPFFTFEHLDGAIVDTEAWDGDDPRYISPATVAAPIAECRVCGQTQSNEPTNNHCYCFPSLFSGPRQPAMVQVFRTLDGRNNGLQALTPIQRGGAIGEFLGLVTKDIEDLDVMKCLTEGRSYQIWQGRQGNFTRFINHSCNPNAQFQHFVWLSTERIILVSKGIAAGSEITVDYSESYWSGLNKRCLCGERCCRYSDGSNGAESQHRPGEEGSRANDGWEQRRC